MQDEMRQAYQRLVALAERDPDVHPPLPDVTAAMQALGLSYADIIAITLAGYADRPAFGVRDYEIRADPRTLRHHRHYLPAFRTLSYAALAKQVEAIASAWQHFEAHRVRPGDHVAFLAFTGAEMSAIHLATVYAQAVSVPLQANLPVPDLAAILAEVAPVTLVASIDKLALAASCALDQQSVRSLVVIDYDAADDDERLQFEAVRKQLGEAGDRIALITFAGLLAGGLAHDWSPLPRDGRSGDDTSMVMSTSGSTGTPKGALLRESTLDELWASGRTPQPTIAIGYAPLNHFMGHNVVCGTLAQGGTIYFTLKSDLSTLLEDIRLARPTYINFMPRIAEMVYQHYQSEVERRVAAGGDPEVVDRDVRAEMAGSYLGDRLVIGGVGSAPSAPEVRAFLRDCFGIVLFEAYAQTEAGGALVVLGDRVMRNMVIDYKLRDVPELGYYATDKPYPRGELLLKTRLMIREYLNRPDASAAIFDDDGFLITGDIFEERGPDRIVWIDRRNNVIKLSQAEFVAIGPLESIYTAGSLISQIYLYGNSHRSFLLAVVVPDMRVARDELGREPTAEELRGMLLAQLQQVARDTGLKSFEVPRDILVEMEPFSYENGLLSSVRKPLRPNLKRRYGDQLEAMYQAMDRKRQEELALLRSGAAGASTVERVCGAFKANLGLAGIDPAGSQSYRDLGGDSLGAASLALLLEEMFGVAVPVSTILGPTGSARRLAQFIDLESSGAVKRPTFASVHGADATVIRAADLPLEAFMDVDTLAAAGTAPLAANVRTVLVTGATGFLGRFLCLQWLERAAVTGGKVICLVRAVDEAAARARLDAAFGQVDEELAGHFHALAQNHLEIVLADLEAPGLGLEEQVYRRLAQEVDHIVHSAALVNHVLSYQHLFEPNVVGTAELIRFALTSRRKSFDNISTVAVPHLDARLGREDVDIRQAAPAIPIGAGYASGYAASKWAGEVLLREAHHRCGLPVNVYRADMILAHSRYRGQINVPDMFTRLLLSLVATGIAPRSFYEPEASSGPRPHYDGLPVDFIAAVMQQIGDRPRAGFRTYNIVNVHEDDGISLDTIVDWIVSAGHELERIDDYADWIRTFGDRLRRLPDTVRQHSSVELLAPMQHPEKVRPGRLNSDYFITELRQLPVGPEVPHLSESFIHKCLDDMVALRLVSAGRRDRDAAIRA